MNAAPLCICHHWDDQHADMNGMRPCAEPGCWCKGAGFFPVARGSRHRPGHVTHAVPGLVRHLRPGDRILITYAGGGRVELATKMADSLIAEVERVSWSGQDENFHIITDLGLIPLVRGRSKVRVVNKS